MKKGKGKGREGEEGRRREEGGRENRPSSSGGRKGLSLYSSAPSRLLLLVALHAEQHRGQEQRKLCFESQGLGKGTATLSEHRVLSSYGSSSSAVRNGAVICIEDHVFCKV